MTKGRPEYVRAFREIDRSHVATAGGKGASLGELSRLEGVRVPPGFCVTTTAFERATRELRALGAVVDSRAIIESVAIPEDVRVAIADAYAALGDDVACAVRSSATAEDAPGASFAGQHDSYLDVRGEHAILAHVRKCWASLFTERAVAYRLRNDASGDTPRMAVVVQQMVPAEVAGVLFTADPLSGNRKVSVVEAARGLGEALVSGTANADSYRMREGRVLSREVHGASPLLTDAQLVALEALGRRIEAHFGRPQDIEWCFVQGEFHVVQARPITTLFPVPEARDGANHVYVSVGHQQMMTDAMTPLGISVWQLTSAASMHTAGGRLFVDVTRGLGSPTSRARLVAGLGKSDPLIGDALQSLVDRGDFVPEVPDDAPGGTPDFNAPSPIGNDPAIVAELVARTEASVAKLRRDIRGQSGVALLDFIVADVQEMRRILWEPRSMQAIMAAMQSTWWLNEKLEAWLGERNAADRLAQSAPGNVTSEMGLALLDVADAIRPHPEVVALLDGAKDDGFLDELPRVPGGSEARDAIERWLDRYGMRGPGEIDITRPRWRERPSMLVPLILNNVRTFASGEARRRFERGLRESARAERELLERLRALPDGEEKAAEAKRMIDRLRTFIGYREYPKFGLVNRYFIYKQALLGEATRLVGAGVLREVEDAYFLTFDELREVMRSGHADPQLIAKRREEFRSFQSLSAPRVLTSEGEAVVGVYRRADLPAGALAGLGVSAGTVEGRARVVVDMARADLAPGDILVTRYTDPSWTPLFVSIAGLVTEVGGLMTHGAVIAREYGLPAVVGVENATALIRDGQRIRVHGTEGFVELMEQEATANADVHR